MNTSTTPIERACELFGSQAALAAALEVTPAAVNQWMKSLRPVPVQHCVSIERHTSGAVTRQELRPNDFWRIWPDLSTYAPVEQES